MTRIAPLLLAAVATISTLMFATNARAGDDREVVIYVALDQPFSEPILRDFEKQSGIKVRAVYDTEATKTIGLVNRIRAERARPRCDVFWNNEIVNTLRLKREGLLQPCKPTEAEHYPPQFRDVEGYWYGFAARARVLIVNTELVPKDQRPTSIADLASERYETGVAKPLFGTAASHIACLFEKLGPEDAKRLLLDMKASGVTVAAGNKPIAEMVGAGKLAFGLTDTDDAIIESEAGKPVEIIFPDQGDDQMGVLLLPNTLCVINGAPHPKEAEELISYLLAEQVEARLAQGPSAQIPIRTDAEAHSRVAPEPPRNVMQVDFEAAAQRFPEAAAFIEKEFLR